MWIAGESVYLGWIAAIAFDAGHHVAGVAAVLWAVSMPFWLRATEPEGDEG